MSGYKCPSLNLPPENWDNHLVLAFLNAGGTLRSPGIGHRDLQCPSRFSGFVKGQMCPKPIRIATRPTGSANPTYGFGSSRRASGMAASTISTGSIGRRYFGVATEIGRAH